jgi:hypothetical protein
MPAYNALSGALFCMHTQGMGDGRADPRYQQSLWWAGLPDFAIGRIRAQRSNHEAAQLRL